MKFESGKLIERQAVKHAARPRAIKNSYDVLA
jgi:hypothetical protein